MVPGITFGSSTLPLVKPQLTSPCLLLSKTCWSSGTPYSNFWPALSQTGWWLGDPSNRNSLILWGVALPKWVSSCFAVWDSLAATFLSVSVMEMHQGNVWDVGMSVAVFSECTTSLNRWCHWVLTMFYFCVARFYFLFLICCLYFAQKIEAAVRSLLTVTK